jgi:hypothetical protein
MSRLASSSFLRDRKATCDAAQRRLRIENLEPRLLLSAGMTSGTTTAKRLGAVALTLGPTADAYVASSSPAANYGSQSELLIQRSGQYYGYAKTAYLKFDLSGTSGDVTKAVLNLTPTSVVSSSRITIRVQLLPDYSDGWVEGGGGTNKNRKGPITWSNASYGTGLVATFSAARLKAGTPVSIDVTKLVKQASNANRVASFLVDLSTQVAATTIRFASHENAKVAYRPTLTVTTTGGTSPNANTAPTVVQQPSVGTQTGTWAVLSVLGDDQEDGESSLRYTWSVTSPDGAATPYFSSNGNNAARNTTVTFVESGIYVFTATIADSGGLTVGTNSVTVTVVHELGGLSVSPALVTLVSGETQNFTATGVDQFGEAIVLSSGSVTWTATNGSFSGDASGATVTYVAPNMHVVATVTAKCGSRSVSASVNVVQPTFLDLVDPTLAALTQSLDADGSISRADMIAILRSVEGEGDGVVDSQDMSDLRTIIESSSTLAMPDYVSVLAKDVVYGNPANVYYAGTKLGNLAVGSKAAQLDRLIDKWFFGTDLPDAGAYSYSASTAGTLFGSTNPSHFDEIQGAAGDCYLLSALGSIADRSPSAIRNMIIDNGDRTWTVRFYYDGTADYVTVNDRLPVDSGGRLVYDGNGTSCTSDSNLLWLELVEKAYVQWNETGRADRDQADNSYLSIESGWMGDVYEQVLGRAASLYYQGTDASNAKQVLVAAIAGGEAVTIGTRDFGYNGTAKLYGNHAYNVLSYNASSGKFTLYNPWGSNQPSQLTWNQLQLYCDSFAATATSGTASFSSGQPSSHGSVIAPPPRVTPPVLNDQPNDAATANGRVARSTTSDDAACAAATDAVYGDVVAVAAVGRGEAISSSTSDLRSIAGRSRDALRQPGDDWAARVDVLFGA